MKGIKRLLAVAMMAVMVFTIVVPHMTTDAFAASKSSIIKGVEDTTIKAKTTLTENGKIKVTWTKSKGYKVDYYQIYRSTSKNGTYKKIYTTKSGTAKSFTNSSVTKGKRYYYKVRGVREVNGKNYYTQWSNKAYRTVKSAVSVPQYMQDVLDEYGITIEEYEYFDSIKTSAYYLRKNYTRQEVNNLFVVDMTKTCGRPLEDYELENIPHFASGYWNGWTMEDDDKFIASGEEPIIEAEYRELMNKGLTLEEVAKRLVEKYPYCPSHVMADILKDGSAYLPFNVADFYK